MQSAQKTRLNNEPKARMVNMELLRIVSMMLVVVLHFLWKGECLPSLSQTAILPQGYLAWGLEALAIVAVNVYMLLSGYFLIESGVKIKRLLMLLLQIWFYSIGIGVVSAAFGYIPADGFSFYYLVQLCLPVSMSHYWFMTAYIFMYLFTPVLSQGIKKLTKRQFQTVLLLLVFTFSVIKSIAPVRLASDMQGYDCIWYICVFMIAAYIRLYGLPFFKNAWRSFLVYLASAACIFGLALFLRFIYLKTGKLENMLTVCYEYNHILVLIASVALFYMFYHIKIKDGVFGRVVSRIAPYTLGVYLWHEHMAVRYEWPAWLYSVIRVPDSSIMLVVTVLAAVASVFVIGILLDMLRSLLFKWMHLLFTHIGAYRSLCRWLDRIDIMPKKEETHE